MFNNETCGSNNTRHIRTFRYRVIHTFFYCISKFVMFLLEINYSSRRYLRTFPHNSQLYTRKPITIISFTNSRPLQALQHVRIAKIEFPKKDRRPFLLNNKSEIIKEYGRVWAIWFHFSSIPARNQQQHHKFLKRSQNFLCNDTIKKPQPVPLFFIDLNRIGRR